MFASTHTMYLDALTVFKYVSEFKLKVCVTGNANGILQSKWKLELVMLEDFL